MLLKFIMAMIIIVIIAIGGIFYNDYLSQTARAESVNAEIQNDRNANTIVQKSIQKVNGEIAETNRNIEKIKQEIEKEGGVLPDKVNSNQILKDIIVQSKETGVSIIPLSTQEWMSTQINKNNYQVLKISLEIKGSQPDVVAFIDQIQQSSYKTLIVDSINLRKPLDPEDKDIIADLNLAIYAK